MQKELRSKIDSIQLRIDEASKKILKESNEISLIAVSKKKSIEHINHAYEIGIRNFGENYAQELEEKVKNKQIDPFKAAKQLFNNESKK